MKIEKIISSNVGTHYPIQAILLTEQGEIFVTKDELTPDKGFELIKFQTYDLTQLTAIVNNVLKGLPIKSAVEVTLANQSIFVSPVCSLYKITSYSPEEVLNQIHGGYQAQIITIVGNGVPLNIKNQGNLTLNQHFKTTNPYSTLMLQKMNDQWVEISRTINL